MDSIAQIDAFFSGKSEIWKVFEALRMRMQEAYPKAQIRVMKTCISFDDPRPFAYVSFPPKKNLSGIWLTISLRERMDHPRFAMIVPVSKSRFTVHIHLPDEDAVNDELLELITLGHH